MNKIIRKRYVKWNNPLVKIIPLSFFFCSKCEMLRPIMPLSDILRAHEKVTEKCGLVSGFILIAII